MTGAAGGTIYCRGLMWMRTLLTIVLFAPAFLRAELTAEQQQVPLEVKAPDPAMTKIVLLAGSPSNNVRLVMLLTSAFSMTADPGPPPRPSMMAKIRFPSPEQ